MTIIKLSSENEEEFWKHTIAQIEEYFFFYMDQKYYPEKTQIYLAWENQHDPPIRGMLLLWNNKIVQIAGDPTIIAQFFPYIPDSVKEITCATEFLEPILTTFPTFKPIFDMHRMVLYHHEFSEVSERIEAIQQRHQMNPIELTNADFESIATLMRLSDPVFWGDRTTNNVQAIDTNTKWYGIRLDGELVAVGNYWLGDIIGIVSVIGTHPTYRRRGLATLLVHTGIQLIFQRAPCALIHVRKENFPAIGTYTKLGYHIFHTLHVLRRS